MIAFPIPVRYRRRGGWMWSYGPRGNDTRPRALTKHYRVARRRGEPDRQGNAAARVLDKQRSAGLLASGHDRAESPAWDPRRLLASSP